VVQLWLDDIVGRRSPSDPFSVKPQLRPRL